MQSLAGKAAVVTGAARGIGRAVAFWVARKGTNIVVNYLQTVNSCFVVIESEKMGGVGTVRRMGRSHIWKVRWRTTLSAPTLVSNVGHA